MPLMQLNLENLSEIGGGKAAAAFMHELKRAALDCEDRPGDKNVRKVLLECSITPVLDVDGCCEQVEAAFIVKSKVPDRKTRAVNLQLRKGGMLVFSSESPENVNQYTFDDVNPETGRVERGDPEKPTPPAE